MKPQTLDEAMQARVRCAGEREEPVERRYLVDVTRTLTWATVIMATTQREAERLAKEIYQGDRAMERCADTDEWDAQACPVGEKGAF